MTERIPLYDTSQPDDLERLGRDLERAYDIAARAIPAPVAAGDDEDEDFEGEVTAAADIAIPDFNDLIGIDPSVRRQIEAALRAGKRHLMLYGPPGTGKTEIARRLGGLLARRWKLITGSADWSSQDIIGGYQPIGDGKIGFVPGVLLQNFDRPLIIDELNRCDIDKVIGPLFTVLSGQASTLPYRAEVADLESEQFVILPHPKPGAPPHEYAPGPAWRLIATINSIDKASLYQMSYALARRFGWIYVDAPQDLDGFVVEFARRNAMLLIDPPAETPTPLGALWRAVNDVRVVGPAPIIDLMRTAAILSPGIDFTVAPTPAERTSYLDGIDLYLIPMLDGILSHEANAIAEAATVALGLAAEEAATLKRRLAALAI
ncbi:MoxR-like ATPase [Sphingomonas sp. SORGH_AS870]|uniref:AAA family ATPase n=1 Tax=Sphingomonas sp. SORGH_AS_0870 TaxID=3041801 RepID=UPI002865966C|nr:AAA family ATPase [Sphingomonas sp. SORGH_AS_0870]MDR6144343.1 MoxR-like ATPase [Sphingomonas sp. SORGH_AS_0870]